MKPKSEKSVELYNMMLRRGYPEPFCDHNGRAYKQAVTECIKDGK